MKTRLLTGAMALALIGCSEKSSETLREAPAYDMAPVETAEVAPQTPSAARSPNIGVTSAPGVAFNYAYAFRLDNSRNAAVQEETAAAGEALGTPRTRITRMTYRILPEKAVEHQISFKLSPPLPPRFRQPRLS